MNNKFAVKVHNKYLSEAVQKLAIDNGYRWPIRGQIINLNETSSVLVFEEKEIRFLLPDDEYDYSALTDWNKIEQAMKPKEPRVIWVVIEKDGTIHDTSFVEKLLSKPDYSRTIKFQEVIE